MVKKSIILTEKELLELLGEVIVEQEFDKTMSYEEYLKKYNLKDNDFVRNRYKELILKDDEKIDVKVSTPDVGDCYTLIENPTNVDVTGPDPNMGYMFEVGEELSGWDTGEETLDIQFKMKPKKEFADGSPVFLKIVINQRPGQDRTPDIGWGVSTSNHGATGSGSGYVIGPLKSEDEITITFKLPSNPITWHETERRKDGGVIYDWPRYAGSNNENNSRVYVGAQIELQIFKSAGRKNPKAITKSELQNSPCNVNIALRSSFEYGTFGKIVWEEFIEASPWDKSGDKDWDKSGWNPKNWDKHIWLDIFAIAALIIAGAFSGGAGWVAAAAYYGGMGVYAGLTLVNAALYYQEGNTTMAGFHLLMEALPYMKVTKRLSQLPRALASKTINEAFQAITKVTSLAGVRGNKTAIQILKQSEYTADMVKALAKYGDETLKTLRGTLKGKVKPSDITDEAAENFMKAVRKESPELGARLNLQNSKMIIAEQSRTFTKRLVQALSGGGNLVADAATLAFLYDANMIWEPFQALVLGRKGEDIKASGWPGLQDVMDFTAKEMLGRFKNMKPRDVVVFTKDENGRRYNWPMVRAMYIRAISNPRISQNSCSTIPAKRHELFKKYEYAPKTEEELLKYNAKQDGNTAGIYQGIPIEASKLVGKSDVNLALKEDFLSGWRPEQKCDVQDFNLSKDKETEILRDAYNDLNKGMSEAEVFYDRSLTEGLEKYKDLTGEYLLLGDVEFRPNPSKESLELLENNFSYEMRVCLVNLMDYYLEWETLPDDDDFQTPETLPCIKKLK